MLFTLLLLEYACNNRCAVGSLKKFATVIGFSHKPKGLRLIGFAGQLRDAPYRTVFDCMRGRDLRLPG